MASANTTHYDAQKASRANTSRRPAPVSKPVIYARIPWTSTALSSGDTINICQLPAGAIPRPELSSIIMHTDITASALTLDIGTAADTNGWAAAVDCAAIGPKPCCVASTAPPAYITKTELAADTNAQGTVDVYATATIGVGTLDAGEVITFLLAYELPG